MCRPTILENVSIKKPLQSFQSFKSFHIVFFSHVNKKQFTVFVYIDIPSDEISYRNENSISLRLRTICSAKTGFRSVQSFSQLLC